MVFVRILNPAFIIPNAYSAHLVLAKPYFSESSILVLGMVALKTEEGNSLGFVTQKHKGQIL